MKRGEAFWILAVAFLLRVGVGLYAGHFQNPYPWEYEWIADNLLQGKGYVCWYLGTPYRALCMPGYPLLCAGLYALTHHSHGILLLLQCFLSALICLQFRAIGRLTFENPAVSRLAAWGVALHPGLILYASRLHSLTLDLLTYSWALWAWLMLYREPSTRRAVGAGLAGGIAALFRGTILPFVLLAMGGFLLRGPAPAWRARLKQAGLAGLLAAAVLSPWLLRNALLFQRFPLFISSSNYVLWIGNNPVSGGGATLPDGRTVLEAAPQRIRDRIEPLDEMGQSRFFREEALNFILSSPGQALRLYGRKLLSFFWFSPQTGVLYPTAYTRAYQWYYRGVAALVLLGLWTLGRRLAQPSMILLLAFVASIALYQSFYYVEGRHRWTVEPVFLLFASQGILTAAGWIRSFR